MLRLPHSNYFHDRHSEEELCQDFPADKIFIRGLHAMQAHFDNNGVYVEIPVVRVMNTAHYIAAYMFATTCSGDQMEYEVLAYDSFGCDKKLVPLTMIVLAAMLQRTGGFRARQCRNLILDNRDPDFEEGVTLYDRFLRSAEKHFAEEDFLIDTHTLVQRNQQLEYENRQLITENKELKYTLTKMENQQNNQYNNCVIYNAAVYNTTTTNNYYPQAATKEDIEPVQTEKVSNTSSIPPDFFCISARFSEDNIRERLDAELKQATSKIDFCRALYRLQHIGCINIDQYASDAQRAKVLNRYQSRYTLAANDFCRARM